MNEKTIEYSLIESVVLQAIKNLNQARQPDAQLPVSVDSVLFGRGSPLDSLGLVSLLIDIEEAFRDEGWEISLSDERAMSQQRSPFLSVSTLIAYIEGLRAADSNHE
ncbi:acyl carrier protein [Desulfonatronum thioautotrophicum]|uniref:acyl carrier protein n=1 Tax=Desulfonatronum thioautotrophicum TaxID=617001 RepID=UPI000B1455B3|nr:acyl carrier protein [Desulfonatronum thioautotrophicum]